MPDSRFGTSLTGCADGKQRMPSPSYRQWCFIIDMDTPLTEREISLLANVIAIAELMEDEPMGFNMGRNPYDAGYQIALQNLADAIWSFIRNHRHGPLEPSSLLDRMRDLYESVPERMKHMNDIENYWRKVGR